MRIYSVLLFIILFSELYSQSSRPFVNNYTPKEYGYQFSSYTHSVCSDSSGYLYAGTWYGILQFNGYKWNFIPVKTGTYISALLYSNGKIYVGCHGDFGYLEPDNKGMLNYVSLTEMIPDDARSISAILKIISNGDYIFYQTEEAVFVYDGKKVDTHRPSTTFHLAFSDGKNVYVRERDKGILEYKNKSFHYVNNSEQFADTGIFALIPAKNGAKIIVTMEAGFFLWNNNTFSQLLDKSLIKQFSDAILIGAMLLPDGNIAAYTLKDGIYILNPDFNVVARYSTSTGMRSSEIHDITTDFYGNLWAATQKGVCRIQYSSPFSFFGETSGLYGNVQSVVVFDGYCYAGTTEGLFSAPLNGNMFSEVAGVKGSIWALAVAGNTLWTGGNNGLWVMKQGSAFSKISSDNCSALSFYADRNRLMAAGENGLKIYNPSTLSMLKSIPDVAADIYGIAYQKGDDGKDIIWLGSKTKGVSQIIINTALECNVDFYFGANDGLADDWVCAYQAADSVLFATSAGFLRFISPAEISRLSGDSSSAGTSIRGYFDISSFPQQGNGKSVTAFTFNTTMSYVALDNFVYRVNMNDFSVNNSWFRTLNMGRNNVLYSDGLNLWIGTDEGLAILDIQKASLMKRNDYIAGIASVTIGNDSVIWYGQTPFTSSDLVISYKYNTIKINLASLFNDNGYGLQYQWKLEGADDYYSEWTSKDELAFNNVVEGNYLLHIKAKNEQDVTVSEITMPFVVLPPWHRTWWAYVIYVVLGIIVIYLLIYLNSRRLVAKNKKLEEIIRQRTQEIVEQKDEIEHQKETIEEILKDLNDSISYAQRIQQAVLPSAEMIKECFDDYFILYRPRNVVSGDFFWATRINEWVVITAADCTGHGVPGAFMSMLGMSFLNEIVRKKEITKASEILNLLRNYVIEALRQSGHTNSQKDGMDMSLCAINTKTGFCNWAGANNPLWLVRNEDIKGTFKDPSEMVNEVKADKMPVAIYIKMEEFTNHEIQLNKGDRLYMFSDGYADQFGGPKGKKFMSKNMKRLIAETVNMTMAEQCSELNRAFDAWLDTPEEKFEQIDDVTVLGIKI